MYVTTGGVTAHVTSSGHPSPPPGPPNPVSGFINWLENNPDVQNIKSGAEQALGAAGVAATGLAARKVCQAVAPKWCPSPPKDVSKLDTQKLKTPDITKQPTLKLPQVQLPHFELPHVDSHLQAPQGPNAPAGLATLGGAGLLLALLAFA